MGHLLKQDTSLRVPGLPYDEQAVASALACKLYPEVVTKAHAQFIDAGCTVLTTNSYAATPYHFKRAQRSEDVAAIAQAAAQCAKQAKEQSADPDRIKVAGCLPPPGESYDTDVPMSEQSMRNLYARLAAALAPHVDLFLVETMSVLAHAKAAVAAAATHKLPIWVAFTLEDSIKAVLRDGEALSGAAAWAAAEPAVSALLLNCCAPQAVSAALPEVQRARAASQREDLLLGAYANAFQTTTSEWLQAHPEAAVTVDAGDYDSEGIITKQAYARFAREWAAGGCTVVGGCCGTSVTHMREVAQELDAA